MKRILVFVACFLMGLCVASAASPKTPTFFARHDYTGLFSGWVQVADTNGDGIPDLIATDAGYIQVLFGNGDGTFRPGPDTFTGISAGAFVATDLNGDRKIDLAFASAVEGNAGGLAVCLGNGDGTFQKAVLYPAGTDDGVEHVVVGDFNGDGFLDAAVAGQSGVWLFAGIGGGKFNVGVLAVPLADGANGVLAAADFNGDGNLDLVVTLPFEGPDGSGAGFAVVLGNGNGTFQTPLMFSEPQKAATLAVGKLTVGGHPSIVIPELSSSNVYLYVGNGAGAFSSPQIISLPGAAGGVAIGDVNGDGVPDLISATGFIALGKPGGGIGKTLSYPVDSNGGSYNVVVADLRNNGLTDIVTDAHNSVSVLLNWARAHLKMAKNSPCREVRAVV